MAMRRYAGRDVPPPGAGLVTVMDAEPAVAIKVFGTVAVSCEEFTNVVVSAAPFNLTTEAATKFEPFTVSVKSAPPGATADGTSGSLISGTGLFAAEATRGNAKGKNNRRAKSAKKRRGILVMV
ncbi:MAG TPA: hypothetical protein VGJ06_01475 [Candidatus Acidoferrum sp.]